MTPEQGETPKPSTLFLKWADDYFVAPQDAVTMGNLWDAWRTAISTSRNGKMLLALEQSRDDANADSVRLLHEKLAALSRAEAAENKLIEDTESFSRAMLKQVDRAEAAEARAGRLEEALEWYADPTFPWTRTQANFPRSAADADGGRRAREALKSIRALPEGE